MSQSAKAWPTPLDSDDAAPCAVHDPLLPIPDLRAQFAKQHRIDDAATNIAAALGHRAHTHAHQAAAIVAMPKLIDGEVVYRQLTFAQLNQQSDILAQGLKALGIGRGVRTVLMVPPSLDFFRLTFALFKAGAVPVLVDPGMGIKNLKACLEQAAPTAFIGTTKAHLARKVLGLGKPTLHTCIHVDGHFLGIPLKQVWEAGEDVFANKSSAEQAEISQALLAQTQLEDVAAVLFTSGSTGRPKGAIYRHRNFLAQVDALKDVLALQEASPTSQDALGIDVATFPLFALFDPALGMTSLIPKMDASKPAQADPKHILSAIEEFAATHMFASPALLDNLSRFASLTHTNPNEAHPALASLKTLVSAGAPASSQTLARCAAIVDNACHIRTPYGATEALPVSVLGDRIHLTSSQQATAKGRGVCVGIPTAGTEVRIVALNDAPLPTWQDVTSVEPGQIGEIVVAGMQVTTGYFAQAHATQVAKILDPKAPGGMWHRMGDAGYLDDFGRLWFCGRKSQKVVLPDGKILFTACCEAIANTHPDIMRSALVGIEGEQGTEPVLCLQPETSWVRWPTRRRCKKPHRGRLGSWYGKLHGGLSKPQAQTLAHEVLELLAQNPTTAMICKVAFVAHFPVDTRHNAKIFRKKLAHWISQRPQGLYTRSSLDELTP